MGTDDKQPMQACARGITLYALWESRLPLPAPPDAYSDGIGVILDELGLWTTVVFTWQPASATTQPQDLTIHEAEHAIHMLMRRMRDLYPTPTPAYVMLHIDELTVPEQRFQRLYRSKQREARQQAEMDAREVFVETIQRMWELGPHHEANGWQPNSFDLYEPKSKRRGWLMLSPRRALLAGVSGEQVALLANVIQPSDTNRAQSPGIVHEYYREVLSRVMQWVSNQDSFEAVNQLKELVASGTKAIDGQVYLNFAVAGIGILLAFMLLPEQKHHEPFIASMICLAAASLFFWLFARNGHNPLRTIGWLCVLAIIPCLLWWPQVSSLWALVVQCWHWLVG